ncbi:MAG: cob(I)yrinic acid a,c-diamide adenosyltransferase [Bacillota bacterium]
MANNKSNPIYTKKGDSGNAKTYSNEEYPKNHIIFECIGNIDELSSFLGLSYHYCKLALIKTIQKHLQSINSQIATNQNSNNYQKIEKITEEDVTLLEDFINSYLEKAPIENQFYLPGSEKTKAGAYIDVSRAITRRCERSIITYEKLTKREDLKAIKMYLNRLSDLLFVLSINS